MIIKEGMTIMKKFLLKIIVNFVTIICIIVSFWFLASIIDTNLHNDPISHNYQDFSSWNIFILLSN